MQNCRDTDTLVFYLSGGHEFTFENEIISAREGQLLYLPKNSKYKNRRLDDNTRYYQIEFNFSCEKTISAFNKPFALSVKDSEAFLPLIRDAYNSFISQSEADLLLCNSNIIKAISFLKGIYNKKLSPAFVDKIAPAITFLEEHYAKSTDIIALAEMCDMSVSNLEKLFLKNFEVSPITYRNKIRIRHAKLLLASGYTLSEVAYKVGFSDVFYFSRIFKKLEGTTPGYFSKQNTGI